MKLDRVERIIIPIAIALMLLLIISQCYLYSANRRLQVQIDTLKTETILRDSEVLERVEYLAHPDTIRRRTLDMLWKQGEFAE